MATAQLNRHDLEAKIVKRCWESDGFRKEFIGDPAGCFAKYLNAPRAQLTLTIAVVSVAAAVSAVSGYECAHQGW